MAINKNWKISVEKDVEKLTPLYTSGGKGKWCSFCGKQLGGSSKSRKTQQLHFEEYTQKN